MSEIKNIGQLLNALATKAGIESNNQALVDILSNAELTKIPIHSDIAKALDENLLSLDAAKDNHPVIGTVYKAQALNGFDKTMQRVIDELELDDETKSNLTGEKSSYKRFETLVNKLKEAKTNKSDASSKVDKDKYQSQIDELQEQLRQTKESLKTKESEFAEQRKSDLIDFKLRNLLTGYKTVFDDLDPDIKHTSLTSAINKELQGKEAKFDIDDNGQLIIIRKDGTKLYGQNNVEIKAAGLIDSTFATNKLLKVTDNQQQQQSGTTPARTITPGNQAPKGNNQAMFEYNDLMAEAFAKTAS